jgi:hypothetical protein
LVDEGTKNDVSSVLVAPEINNLNIFSEKKQIF